MKRPLVSVVVICYNYARYLTEAVESVLNQTYSNVEIIIVNDGSTDNTHKVVQQIVKLYPKIRYIKQENKGVVYTRNRAIAESKGEYLIQLDADDFLDSNYVQEVMKVAQNTDADIVYTDFETFGIREPRKSDFPEHNIERLKNANYIHIASLIKRAAVGGIRFDPELDKRSHEDWDFFLCLSAQGAKAMKCKGTLLHYRIHGEGRNNSVNSASHRLDYLVTYSYIISKHVKSDPGNYEYLFGQTAAAWYKTLYGNYQRVTGEKEELARQLVVKQREIDEIRSSVAFRTGNKLARPIRGVKRALRGDTQEDK